jgi:hypothetical protein
MPRHFAIDQRVSPEHLSAFCELIRAPSTTIESALIWLRTHGYRISHGAVQRFVRRARMQATFTLRPSFGLGGDKETRRQLAAWATRLDGDDLTALALFAVFLLNVRAARRGEQLPGIAGTIPMRSTGDRTAVDGPAV